MDLISGVCVNNLGHNHPLIIEAIRSQLEKHLHVMVYGEFIQKSQLDLSKNLLELLPKKLDCVYVVILELKQMRQPLNYAKPIPVKLK